MKIKGNDEVTLFLRPSLLFLRDSGFVQQAHQIDPQKAPWIFSACGDWKIQLISKIHWLQIFAVNLCESFARASAQSPEDLFVKTIAYDRSVR